MNKKIFIGASLLLLSGFLPAQSNYTNSGACEIAGMAIGTLAGILSFTKEYRKTINHTSELRGFDGVCYSLLNIFLSPIAFQLGQFTAKSADQFLKEASCITRSTRMPVSEKIGNIALNTAGAVCLFPASLALHTIGGQTLGKGLGHLGAIATDPAIRVLHDVFETY